MLIDALIFLVLALILLLAVLAIVRGWRGRQAGADFPAPQRAARVGYRALCAVHLCAGACVVVCYAIALCLFLTQL